MQATNTLKIHSKDTRSAWLGSLVREVLPAFNVCNDLAIRAVRFSGDSRGRGYLNGCVKVKAGAWEGRQSKSRGLRTLAIRNIVWNPYYIPYSQYLEISC